MKLEAKASRNRNPGVSLVTNDLGQMAAMQVNLILTAFEEEVDSLINLARTETRGGGTIEQALIRRLQSDQEIYEELKESMRRIDMKMDLAQDQILGTILTGG